MKLYILIAFLIAFAVAQTAEPQQPQWPDKFAQDFVETWSIDNATYRDVGTYFYDYTTNTHRLARSNGIHDAFCGFNSEPLACDHIVVNDDRYMFFPEVNECCYCCGYADGCAILKPKWFIDPEFLGKIEFYGQDAYKWVIYEGPGTENPNYYIETTEEDPTQRQTLYLARLDYQQNYILESRRTEFAPIYLPLSCNRQNLCPGVCEEVRGPQVA